MKPCVLMTGATGFLGGSVARRLRSVAPDVELYGLARRPVRSSRYGGPALEAFEPVEGDLRAPDLGIDPEFAALLSRKVTHVIHLGAIVRFDTSIEDARMVNVQGTKSVIEFACRCERLERLIHVSTTFVPGERMHTVAEGAAEPGRFRNNYELSKFEAEQIVEEARGCLPIIVVRPSIVGPSLSHLEHSPFLLLVDLYRGSHWQWVPGRPDSVVDLVPADMVATGICGAALSPEVAPWIHLAAGKGATTLEDCGRMASQAWGLPALRFLDNAGFERVRAKLPPEFAKVLERLATFVPYLSVQTRVDATEGHRLLRLLNEPIPTSAEYFRGLIDKITTSPS